MNLRRREFLQAATASVVAAGLAACAGQETAPPVTALSGGAATPKAGPKKPMKLLILGGTKFLGPELVEVARAHGHALTLFNRGKTNPGMFPDVEKLHGDRDDGTLDALRGRTWDAVIDTSGFVPRKVKATAELLAGSGQYLFVSSISVYDKPPRTGVDETGAVGALKDPAVEKIDEVTYGPLKAACERAAEAAMPGKVTNVRPGLIVGPGDGSDRYTYWPVRLAAGGDVMAPGSPADPVQWVDVRDLAAWIISAAEERHMGVYDVVGPKETIGVGPFLTRMNAALGNKARLEWVDAKFLAAQKVEAWSDMPVWVDPTSDDAGVSRVSSARAIARGLTFRPLEATTKDTLAWFATLPEERRQKLRAGISRTREAEVLAAWRASRTTAG
jgi:2'-hydroxyisoflavone reductase